MKLILFFFVLILNCELFAAQIPDELLTNSELLDRYSASIDHRLISMRKFLAEQQKKFSENFKRQTAPDVFEKLEEKEKQQLCWKALLLIKDHYANKKEAHKYDLMYLNIAKFLLTSKTYPENLYKDKPIDERNKIFHRTVIHKIDKIVNKSTERDKINKWSRIYLALLYMEYAKKFKPENKDVLLEKAYILLNKAKSASATKAVNFYLAKLILHKDLQYIPDGHNSESARRIAEDYLWTIREYNEREKNSEPGERREQQQPAHQLEASAPPISINRAALQRIREFPQVATSQVAIQEEPVVLEDLEELDGPQKLAIPEEMPALAQPLNDMPPMPAPVIAVIDNTPPKIVLNPLPPAPKRNYSDSSSDSDSSLSDEEEACTKRPKIAHRKPLPNLHMHVVEIFKKLEKEKGYKPNITEVYNNTKIKMSYGGCAKILHAEGLVTKKRRKALDQATQQRIKKYWHEHQEEWNDLNDMDRQRLTAQEFNVGIGQVERAVHPEWFNKAKAAASNADQSNKRQKR